MWSFATADRQKSRRVSAKLALGHSITPWLAFIEKLDLRSRRRPTGCDAMGCRRISGVVVASRWWLGTTVHLMVGAATVWVHSCGSHAGAVRGGSEVSTAADMASCRAPLADLADAVIRLARAGSRMPSVYRSPRRPAGPRPCSPPTGRARRTAGSCRCPCTPPRSGPGRRRRSCWP